MQKNGFQIVLCTCPTSQVADALAHALVHAGLAACVNIVGPLRSVYRWQGQIESAEEHLLVIKAAAAQFPAIEALIQAQHPYELPEVIAVPVVAGSAAYLSWLSNPDT